MTGRAGERLCRRLCAAENRAPAPPPTRRRRPRGSRAGRHRAASAARPPGARAGGTGAAAPGHAADAGRCGAAGGQPRIRHPPLGDYGLGAPTDIPAARMRSRDVPLRRRAGLRGRRSGLGAAGARWRAGPRPPAAGGDFRNTGVTLALSADGTQVLFTRARAECAGVRPADRQPVRLARRGGLQRGAHGIAAHPRAGRRGTTRRGWATGAAGWARGIRPQTGGAGGR